MKICIFEKTHSNMNTALQIRQDLHQVIEKVQNTDILNAVFTILKKEAIVEEQEVGLDNEQDEGLKTSLIQALEESADNPDIPHEEIWTQLNKKYQEKK